MRTTDRKPSHRPLASAIGLRVALLASFLAGCAAAPIPSAGAPASASTSEPTGLSASVAPTSAPSGGTTECGASGYPCDWADVPSDIIDETERLTGEARSRIQGGAAFAEVADWLRAQHGIATVEADVDALRFRPVGGRPMWIVAAASFRGPTVSEGTGIQLASSRLPYATPPGTADSLVGGDVEAKKALVLSPYLWDFDPWDSGAPVAGVLEATRGYAGHVTLLANAAKADQTVGLEEFEHWDEYDVVFVSSHGARICFAGECRAAIAAGQLPANQPLLSYRQQQLLRGTGIELVTDSTGSTGMLLGADFFRNHYPGGLDETLVIVDACQTLGPKVSDIAEALRGTTSEYLGWTETVNSDVSTAASVALLKKLSEGVTVKHAYESLGSLKNDPATGAQLTLAGRPVGDLRIREIVSFRDVTGASQLSPGTRIDITGTPGDGAPDRVPWHVIVAGLDPEEAGATPLHVTIEGTTANPVVVSSGREVKKGAWLVDGEVALTSDLAAGQQLSMRASVDLVDMGTSTTDVNVTVADARHATDCASLLPQADVLRAVGVDIGQPTLLGEYSVLNIACVWKDVAWELQGQAKDPPFPPTEGQLGGIPCAKSGHLGTTIYCLNEDQGVVGGFVFTSRWGLIVGTAKLSIDQVVDGIIPILDRTAN